jgi:hypothetical protein
MYLSPIQSRLIPLLCFCFFSYLLSAQSTWVQTSQSDFDAGVKDNVNTSKSPGDVKLTQLPLPHADSTIETAMDVWGLTAKGIDLRNWTNSTLHYLGCPGDGCDPVDWYTTYDSTSETLTFGANGNTVRAVIDPNDMHNDSIPDSYSGCCSGPLGLCNAPDTNNNSVAIDSSNADALCKALGYKDGTLNSWTSSNSCPEAHSNNELGTQWDSDWTNSNGYGSDWTCSGFRKKISSSGTLASQVFDAGINDGSWSQLTWHDTLPPNTNITFEVRASNASFAKTDTAPSWTSVGGNAPVKCNNLPDGRYMQWRATLSSSDTTETPTLHEVTVYYNNPLGGQFDSIQDISCVGCCDGSVDLTVQGGTSPYSYNWNNGDTTQDISDLCEGIYTVTITDSFGCTHQDTATVSAPSDIAEHTGRSTFNIYPNPAKHQLHIKYQTAGNTAAVSLINRTGKTVKKVNLQNPAGNRVINTSQLTPGLYFIRIEADDSVQWKKVSIL